MTRLRIFTDGGAYAKDNGKFTAVSSYRIYKDDELLHDKQEVHDDKTNNYAEIYAIATALENVQDYLEVAEPEEFSVEVYSDSLLCVQSLNVWIYNWIKKAKDGVMYNSTGQKVANQELIKRAFKIKYKLKGHINVWHINSHEPLKKVKELYKKFLKFNKCDITYDDFLFAYLQNKKCDEAIDPIYREFIKNNNVDNKDINLDGEVTNNEF